METNPTFFRDLAYVFLAAIGGGLVAWRLRQPLIIGYVLAGMIISPFTPGPTVGNVHTLELFAEIGVILLMFSIGLEFSVKDLLRTKWVALVGGPLGLVLLIGLSVGVGQFVGWSVSEGIVVGAVICVASTMVLTRLLLDNAQLHTESGRVMVGITLVEDLAVVVLIVLIPNFGTLEASRFWAIGKDLGLAAVILVPALLVASKVVPPVLKRVARTRSRELFFVVVLAICLGTAALTQSIGLSLALGAFVAGLMVSGSDYTHEALAQIFPVRDAFVALFFVTIGMLIDPRMLLSNVPLLAVLVLLIVVGKFAVWTGVVKLFGYSMWTAMTVGVGLTQIGEFSFILVQVARTAGIVGQDIYNATLAASLVTILLNVALVRTAPGWLGRRRLSRQTVKQKTANAEANTEGLSGHVVLCGYGRVGSAIGVALDTFHAKYVVVEIDPDIVTGLRARGVRTVFGDPAHFGILQHAGAARAGLVIVTLPDAERAQLAIQLVRQVNKTVPVLARAHRRADHEMLRAAGATEIIQPELEASATLIRHAMSYLKLPDEQTRAYLRGFREAMDMLQERPSTSLPEVREVSLGETPLAGMTLKDTRIRELYGVTVIAIERATGETLVNPSPVAALERGDRLRVFGRSEGIDAFEVDSHAIRESDA